MSSRGARSLEDLVADEAQPVDFRIMAWWLMLQSWGTLRFADHRGLEPSNVRFEGGMFLAKLTRSKTLGSDKQVSSRLVVVDQEAHIRNRTWVKDGWQLLQLQAPFDRDYLLPAPSGNFAGVQIRELRYDTAFGVQSRILRSLCYHGNRLFNFAFPHFWSPHNGRNSIGTIRAEINSNYFGGFWNWLADSNSNCVVAKIIFFERFEFFGAFM